MYDRRGFVMGYFVGASGVVVMAIADKKGPSGQPLTVDGVDDRAYRKHKYGTTNRNMQIHTYYMNALDDPLRTQRLQLIPTVCVCVCVSV